MKTVLAIMALATTFGASAANFKDGEVIVKYKDGVVRTRSLMNSLYSKLGVRHVHRFNGVMKGFETLTLNEGIKVQDAIAELQRDNAVEYAQPNYILYATPVQVLNGDQSALQGGIPCIPGLEIPGCEPGGGAPGTPPPGDGGGGGGIPCIIPGIPFPPGCEDGGDGGGSPWPGDPGTPPAPGNRPALQPAPAEVNPPVADPDIVKAYGLDKIQATQAWNEWKGSKDFIVADIDTGIDYNHEDLAFNVWRGKNADGTEYSGWNFVHNDSLPYDDNQHGTHTSGTIAATGGNGKGVSGVIQRVSLMGLKFLSGEGSGTTSDAIKSIDFAIEKGARVLSNSWGGPGDDGNKALYDSIERAKAKDVLFIAAAGNDSKNNDIASQASYPAAFDNDNLIAVAATDNNDKMAYFSNFGAKTVHLAAPGANVYSLTPGNKYASFSGTSMACPHVAGAAALVWSKNPTWSYKKVKEVLMKSVDQLPSLNGKTITGGRLNVLKALRTTE